MSNDGAALRAAARARNARAEASRRNGAKSRGPRTPEGKARAAQNGLKHGMRAQKHVLLPQEDAAAFAALESAILAELGLEGALRTVLARRVAIAAWRLKRADRMEAERSRCAATRAPTPGSLCLAAGLGNGAPTPFRRPRDGNGTRAFETLLRYRNAAMAEFTRALRTLKALQAEQASASAEVLEVPLRQSRAPEPRRPEPNEPGRRPEPAPERRLEYVLPTTPPSDHTLHEPAPWTPNEPDAVQASKANGATASTRSRQACAPRSPRVAWTA